MLHFYEGQIRKFLTQFVRILSNFSVETGKGSDDSIILRSVPVTYGDPTRQVANIIKNNSENALSYAPRRDGYGEGVSSRRHVTDRIPNPYFKHVHNTYKHRNRMKSYGQLIKHS